MESERKLYRHRYSVAPEDTHEIGWFGQMFNIVLIGGGFVGFCIIVKGIMPVIG